MTPDELRNLDAEVHTKVMHFRCRWWDGAIPGYVNYDGMDWRDDNGAAIPRYSSTIEDAWKVVEEIDLFGDKDCSLTRVVEDNYWLVSRLVLIGDDEWDWRQLVEGETAPLAICKAALYVISEG